MYILKNAIVELDRTYFFLFLYNIVNYPTTSCSVGDNFLGHILSSTNPMPFGNKLISF